MPVPAFTNGGSEAVLLNPATEPSAGTNVQAGGQRFERSHEPGCSSARVQGSRSPSRPDANHLNAARQAGSHRPLQGKDTSGTTLSFTLDIPGQAPADFQPTVGTTDTGFGYTPCYCRGTLIGTGSGQTSVEKLKIGDEVMTKSGALRPIKWIGRRSYSGRFIMGRKDILPICIKAGALDENVPRRDLRISPHHAMYLNGVLIEAKDLVNGVSIVQTERVAKVEYFHIELDSHDVIIAEGALSESFIDDDSRGMFHNAHEYRALYPEAAPGLAQYCAPRHEDGYEVEAARRRIDARAGLENCS